MSQHAVIWLDHHQARIHEFDAAKASLQKVREHVHATGQHHAATRSQHEFYAEVCDALQASAEVLVTGAHMAQADFRHYVEKHRPALVPRIVGWQTMDHPSDGELLSSARKYFDRRTRLGM